MFSFLLHFFLGWITGSALQLQQATLWPDAVNLAGFFTSALVLVTFLLRRHRLKLASFLQCLLLLVISAATAFFCCAFRAQVFLEKQIAPRLEGQVLQVVGRVTAMPHRMQENIRFRFAVQSAQLASGELVELPPQVMLGWYVSTVSNGPAL